jgi:hypothetical protein
MTSPGVAEIYGDRRPDAAAPAWLDKYALVSGAISSAPLDLPERFEAVLSTLAGDDWRVVVRSIGTDFGPIPSPKTQPVEVYLWRADPFTAEDAQSALHSAIGRAGMGYQPLNAWLGELAEHVVKPTAKTVISPVVGAYQTIQRNPWTTIALIVGAGFILWRVTE